MGTTKQGSRYQPQTAILENAYTTLYQGVDLKTQEPILIRTFKKDLVSSEADWSSFRQSLETCRAITAPGMLRAIGISGSVTRPSVIIKGTTGESLRSILGSEENDSMVEWLPRFRGVASALDHLHQRGQVHGDVRPETLFRTPDGVVALNEVCTHYALCGWTQERQTMDRQFFGAVFPTTHLAPEVSTSGGTLDARTDQYGFALVLLELCAGVFPRGTDHVAQLLSGQGVSASRQADLKSLKPILEQALATDPSARFSTCTELLAACEKALDRPSHGKWIGKGLGAAALMVGMMLATKAMLGGGESSASDESWKDAARVEIADQFQMDIIQVPNHAADLNVPPGENTVVAPYFEKIRENERDRKLGDLKSRLSSVSLKVLDKPASESFSFLYGNDQKIRTYLDPNKSVAWNVLLNFSKPLDEDSLDVRVELWNADSANPLKTATLKLGAKAQAQLFQKWNADRTQLTVAFDVPSEIPRDVGMGFYFKVWLTIDETPYLWQVSPVWHVGQFERIRKTLKFGPGDVLNAKFEYDTKIDWEHAQKFTLKATGTINPANAAKTVIMTGSAKQKAVEISPFGMDVNSKGGPALIMESQEGQLANQKSRWGALLSKIGDTSPWEFVVPQSSKGETLTLFAKQSGRFYLSINSAKVNESTYWQSTDDGGGEFEVTIESESIRPIDLPQAVRKELPNVGN